MSKLRCRHCGKEITTKGATKFCSRQCTGAARRKSELRNCLTCGAEFVALEAEIVRRGAIYCSKPCRGIAQRRPATERFWEKVVKTSDCWLWSGALQANGYGRFGETPSTGVLVHRYSYELSNGTIPNGLEIDHLCNNRRCVNPLHMEAVTHFVNMQRATERRSVVA